MKEKGFTLIELMVVIAILGVLASIAIVASMRWINAAREVEANLHIGRVNRAQQAFFTERSQFAGSFNQLEVSVKGTPNYRYSIPFVNQGIAWVYAEPNLPMTRHFAGVAWYDEQEKLVRVKTCQGSVLAMPECLPD